MNSLSLQDDEAFVEGRSYEQAVEFLARAEKAGLDPHVVRTTSFGYIVPKSLLEKDDDTQADENPAATEDPATGQPLTPVGGTEGQNVPSDEQVEKEQEEAENLFNPDDHTVKEIEKYLGEADEAERERVLAAEREGQNRKAFQDATSEENV